MKQSESGFPVDGSKKAVMAVLFVLAFAICVSGTFFCVYSIVSGVSFQVINTKVPGFLFGIAVLYLGIRYTMKLFKLKSKLYKPTSRFSWDNFKRRKHKDAQ